LHIIFVSALQKTGKTIYNYN